MPQVKHANTDYAIGSWGPVLLQFWSRRTPVGGAHRALAAARALTAPQTATLIVVPAHSEMPGRRARELLSGMPNALPGCAGLALVYEGRGFRASTVRAVMTGMMMLSRKSASYRIFPSELRAATWLSGRLALPGSPEALARAMAELRSAQG